MASPARRWKAATVASPCRSVGSARVPGLLGAGARGLRPRISSLWTVLDMSNQFFKAVVLYRLYTRLYLHVNRVVVFSGSWACSCCSLQKKTCFRIPFYI